VDGASTDFVTPGLFFIFNLTISFVFSPTWHFPWSVRRFISTWPGWVPHGWRYRHGGW
jgi:hypothetical protein